MDSCCSTFPDNVEPPRDVVAVVDASSSCHGWEVLLELSSELLTFHGRTIIVYIILIGYDSMLQTVASLNMLICKVIGMNAVNDWAGGYYFVILLWD